MSHEVFKNFSKNLRLVLETSVSVQLQVTKCVTIGPPRAGKTSLKHLLLGIEFDPNLPSTIAVKAPEWVEVHSEQEDQRSWRRLTVDQQINQIYKTIADLPGAEEQSLCTNVDDTFAATAHRQSESQLSKEGMDMVDMAQLKQLESREPSDTFVSEGVRKLDKALTGFQDKEKMQAVGNVLGSTRLVYFIDCGGHPAYQDVQPILNTVPSVYLVVFSLEECINRKDKSAFFHQELIQRPLKSIHLFASPPLLPEVAEGLKEVADGQQASPKGQQEGADAQHRRARSLQEGAKDQQERTRHLQEVTKSLQEGAKCPQKRATSQQEGTKDSFEGTTSQQEEAEGQQEGAKRLQERAKDQQEGAIRLQKGAKDQQEGAISLQKGAKDQQEEAKRQQKLAESLQEGAKSLQERTESLWKGTMNQQEGAKDQQEATLSLQERTKDQHDVTQGQQKEAQKYLTLASSSPSVFIVGTHLDKIEESKQQRTLRSISQKIEMEITKKPYRHISRRCVDKEQVFWAVDNRKAEDLTGDNLKLVNKLCKHVMEGSNDAVATIPLRWMLLAVGSKSDDSLPKFYGYKELFTLCKAKNLVKDLGEYDTMLYVFHTLGLFYFPILSLDISGTRRKPAAKDLVFTHPDCFYEATSQVLRMCCNPKQSPDAKAACPLPGVICNTALLLKAAKLDHHIDQAWFMELLADLRIVAKQLSGEYIFPAALRRSKVKLPERLSAAPLFLTFTLADLEATNYIPTGILCAFISEIITAHGWEADLESISRRHIAFTVPQNQEEMKDVSVHVHILERTSHIEIGLQMKSPSLGLCLSVKEIAHVCHSVRKTIEESLSAAWRSIYGSASCPLRLGFQCTQHSKRGKRAHIAMFESDGCEYLLSCSEGRTGDCCQEITVDQHLWLPEVTNKYLGTVMHYFQVLPRK